MKSNNFLGGIVGLFRLLIVFGALILAGCGDGGGGGGSSSAATGSLKIANGAGQSIYYLYVSAASSSSWGSDQLGSSVIANGSSFTLTSVPAGSYDVKVIFADGTIRYQYGVSVTSGNTTTVTFSAVSGTTGSIKATNSSGVSQYYWYVRTAGAASWGVDQLGSSILANGSSFTLTGIAPGAYDTKFVQSDGVTSRYLYNFNVTAGTTYTVTVVP
jgi:hypothetical protein